MFPSRKRAFPHSRAISRESNINRDVFIVSIASFLDVENLEVCIDFTTHPATVLISAECRMAALNADRGPLFKVILLGEAGVGKTAIFHRAKDNSFLDRGKNTVGIDSFSMYIKVGDQQVTVSYLWHSREVLFERVKFYIGCLRRIT